TAGHGDRRGHALPGAGRSDAGEVRRRQPGRGAAESGRLPGAHRRPMTTLRGHLVLTGYMGAGKSTVGALLAQRLRRPFIDLDREIERSTGQSIPTIFSEQGEAGFRRLEAQALAEALAGPEAVIAAGGGALLAAESRRRARR